MPLFAAYASVTSLCLSILISIYGGLIHFPTLEKRPFEGDVQYILQHTPGYVEWYALGVPLPCLCVPHSPFYCGGLTTMGGLVGLVSPRSTWLVHFGLSGGCWLMVGRSRQEAAGCRTPGTPRDSAGSLVCRVRVQETPGLVPAFWWVKPGSRARASSLEGRNGFWSLVAGPRVPELVLDCCWAETPGCRVSKACIGLLMGGLRVQPVPGLVLACVWWAVSEGCGAAVVLQLVSPYWWVRLVLKPAQACWWVGLGPSKYWTGAGLLVGGLSLQDAGILEFFISILLYHMHNYIRVKILMLSPSVLFIKLIMFSFVLLILLILLKSNWPISTLSEHIVQHTIISHSEPHSGLVLVQQLIMYLPPDLRKEYIYFLKCSSSRVSMLMKQWKKKGAGFTT